MLHFVRSFTCTDKMEAWQSCLQCLMALGADAAAVQFDITRLCVECTSHGNIAQSLMNEGTARELIGAAGFAMEASLAEWVGPETDTLSLSKGSHVPQLLSLCQEALASVYQLSVQHHGWNDAVASLCCAWMQSHSDEERSTAQYGDVEQKMAELTVVVGTSTGKNEGAAHQAAWSPVLARLTTLVRS